MLFHAVLVDIFRLPPRRCKISLVGQSAGLFVPRSPVRFRQKLQKKIRELKSTFIHIKLPAKLLDYFLRRNKSNVNQCSSFLGLDHCVQHNDGFRRGNHLRVTLCASLLRRHLKVIIESTCARHCIAAAGACPGFPTDMNVVFNVPTSFNILTCSQLLWGPRS